MKNCGYLQHKRTQQNKIPQTYKFDVRVGILNNLKKKKKTEWNFILLISSYYLCAVLNIYIKKNFCCIWFLFTYYMTLHRTSFVCTFQRLLRFRLYIMTSETKNTHGIFNTHKALFSHILRILP